jgi:sporulation protein YlmC with PRC-barrel domain
MNKGREVIRTSVLSNAGEGLGTVHDVPVDVDRQRTAGLAVRSGCCMASRCSPAAT